MSNIIMDEKTINYDIAYKHLEEIAHENSAKYYEIVEDSCEHEHGLMLIVYYDEKHKDEAYHVCVDVMRFQ